MTAESTAMKAFVTSNPHLAEVAQERDKDAQDLLGELMYETYDQGSAKVIALRAKATDAGKPATCWMLKGSANRGTLRCDTCNEHFPDFNYSAFVEHNWEIHTRHPSELLFCPVGTCDVSTFVSRSAQMDDHLANNHQGFCNMAGRGGDYLENTTDPSLLSHLNRAAALYVLAEDCLKAEAILEEKARLLKKAQQHNVTLRALEREFPSDLAPDSPDTNEVYMTKAEVVEIIVKLREKMKEWYSSFVQVQDLLERRMNGDNVEDHQDMKNDSTSTRARTSSLRKRRRADRKVL